MNYRKVSWTHYQTLIGVQTALAQVPPGPIALDFEAASIYSLEEKALAAEELKQLLLTEPKNCPRCVTLRQVINSDGLSNPAFVQITHMSLAWSEYDALVIIFDSPEIHEYVLNWLVTTDRLQIWHNLGYDGKLIRYFTGKFPKYYEDTQILAKTLINHCEVGKALTGLKHLAGAVYGEWSIAAELDFTEENKHDPKMLEYAAIDSAATMYLWNDMHKQIKELSNEHTTTALADTSCTESFSL